MGATDYILKDRLSRLAPATLQEGRERAELKRADQALKESEARYRTIFENTGTATFIADEKTLITLTDRQLEQLSGYSRSEIEGKKLWTEFIFPEDLAVMKKFTEQREKSAKKQLKPMSFGLPADWAISVVFPALSRPYL